MVVSIVVGIIICIVAVVIFLEYRNKKRYEKRQLEKEFNSKTENKPTTATPATKIQRGESPKPAHLQQQPKPSTTVPKTYPPSNETPKQTTPPPKTQKPKVRTQAPLHKSKTEPASSEAPKKKEESKDVTHPAPAHVKEQKTQGAIKESSETKEVKKPQTQDATTTEKQPDTAVQMPQKQYPDFNYERLLEMGLSEEEAYEFIQELIPQIGSQIPLLEEALKTENFNEMEHLTHSIKGSSTTIGTGGISDLLTDYNTYLKEEIDVRVVEGYQKQLKIYFEKLKAQFPAKN